MDHVELPLIERLTKDIASASVKLGPREARFLVDAYYTMQESRKRSNNQLAALGKDGEPNLVLDWFATQSEVLESQVRRALDRYSAADPLGMWARSICGIGPVISAGLLAHISFEPWCCAVKSATVEACTEREPHPNGACGRHPIETAGHLWSFAGLNPNAVWEKGKKRPWNASLRRLSWLISESFVKVSGRENDYYGKIYLQRKEKEIQRNEAGEFAQLAADVLKKTPTHAQRATYAKGQLPDGHIHSRAKRYAVKLFLAHYFEVGYELHHGKPPPAPYPIAILGHAHIIRPPH